ncbi:hypothetical protein PTTG_25889 [Puccinia triticina 1-1 BBBD Race 1]|uniref:RING-type domain-containing protein n=1 Tax=Puccinia triticina (isolate 1-1 / race 1 (BBBD)) TaxID=630390 RepID=A0A180GZM7_PUCT1|nr:hypothetical protein PTTG_25889 [Puccinia triticina 1-1 BBBD Race 1]
MNSVNRLSRIDALKESQDVSSSQDCAIAMLASGYQSHTPVQGLAHRRDFNHRNLQGSRENLKRHSSHPDLNGPIVIDIPDDDQQGEPVTWRKFQEPCPICLEWIRAEETTEWNGCGHEFHKTCIDKAKKKMKEKLVCPLCRRLPSGEESPVADLALGFEGIINILHNHLQNENTRARVKFWMAIQVFTVVVIYGVQIEAKAALPLQSLGSVDPLSISTQHSNPMPPPT